MDQKRIAEIKNELERRTKILIELSHNPNFLMEPFERNRIQNFLEKHGTPEKPKTIEKLMKHFCVSSFSYAPLRNNFLAPFIGELPSTQNIDKALHLAFGNPDFLDIKNWQPQELGLLAKQIQNKSQFDLKSKQFRPRIIAVLISGSAKMQEELQSGLETFYTRIRKVIVPEDMWKYVNDSSKKIIQVGPALFCDFLKEIGFTRYVKVDHHFRKEFPQLIGVNDSCRKMSFKKSFILSQEIADKIGISPYLLDSLLYLWGRYGK